ncbi:DNA alkylation repair protein [Streptomyces sp. OF3]|uniref:DNA alkylation repair protein n=1 Tax=Streptomyces alkaliterrae TaxID=2213162 RepID=A0A7W3WMM1_9ACTN|nr:DNA alkylation repair protein [Streptomyces alkaliterrae]MBB1255126.1 DNA alkylation repair protein [Streptomyces alkaliterrae]
MPLADELLPAETADALATRLVGPARPATALRACADALAGRAYGERVELLRDAVLADLPRDFPAFAAVVRAALGDPEFTGWMTMPVCQAVAVRGRESDDAFEPALALLAELTPRLTAEFAVRPFLLADQPRALAVIRRWVDHPDPHVRRLASEGTRPRLPWAVRLPALAADPTPVLPLLDALYRDDSEYVRRSVANHLNDVSREHPALAVETAGRWLAAPAATTERVVRHGLRTLIKAGDTAALAALGHDPDVPLVVDGPRLAADTVTLGGHLEFECAVTNKHDRAATVVVDYVVHHLKANGTRNPKVFKLATRTLEPGETWRTTRRHSIRPLTTRRYHPGEHAVQLQTNGRRHPEVAFTLLPAGGPPPARD